MAYIYGGAPITTYQSWEPILQVENQILRGWKKTGFPGFFSRSFARLFVAIPPQKKTTQPKKNTAAVSEKTF